MERGESMYVIRKIYFGVEEEEEDEEGWCNFVSSLFFE